MLQCYMELESKVLIFKQNYTVQSTDKELKRYLKERVFDVVEIA